MMGPMIQKLMIPLVLLFSLQTLAAEIKLALNWKAEPQFGGFYAAIKKLPELKLLEGGSGSPTLQMLAAKQVDYAVVSADEIILAHDRGATDIIAVFAAFQTNPQGIMTHAERGFKKIEDVFQSEGTLMWQSGLPYAQWALKKYKPLKVKTAPYSGGIGLFQNDKNVSQQCFVTSEPLLAEASGIAVKTFLIADLGYNPYTTVLATRASFLKGHKQQVEKVVSAVKFGWQAYLKDPKPTNSLMASLNKAMSLQNFQKSADAQKPLIGDGSGAMTKERWDTLVEQLFELKMIHKKPKSEALFLSL
jgi:NitT/TauT family transport system substrate-binding protein